MYFSAHLCALMLSVLVFSVLVYKRAQKVECCVLQ